jgi:hypothetical protein
MAALLVVVKEVVDGSPDLPHGGSMLHDDAEQLREMEP